MVDIHTHIIPRFDDGVQSEEDAIALATQEAIGGTHTIIATPHVQTEVELRDAQRIVERVTALQKVLRSASVSLQVVPGAELDLSINISKALDDKLPITLAGMGRHVLLDLPMSFFPMNMDEILFDIQSRGVTPILAHPERAGPFQENPDLLESFIEKGVCCQINARSLRGKYGPRAEECAVIFLERRLPHFIASDAHAPRPQPILAGARDDVRDEVDDAYWTLLTKTSGECLLKGEALPPLPSAPSRREKKKGLFRRIFGR